MKTFSITNSLRSTFLECQKKYYFEYVCRLTPVREPVYFLWGSLVHDIAANIDLGMPQDKAIELARIDFEEDAAKKPDTQNRIETATEMFEVLPSVFDAYLLRWQDEMGRYEQLGVEFEFDYVLPSGDHFKGKIDRICRDVQTGEILIWERKTAANADDDYWEQKLLDTQHLGYMFAAQRCLGYPVTKCMYDIYGKPSIRHGKTETREVFVKRWADTYLLKHQELFVRHPMRNTQDEIDAYEAELQQVAECLRFHDQEGIWLQHHPGNRRGGCTYQSLCVNGEHSFARRFFYQRDTVHPELLARERQKSK